MQVVLEQRCIDEAVRHKRWQNQKKQMASLKPMTPIARLKAKDELSVINGSIEDCIIDSQGDLLLLQGSVWEKEKHLMGLSVNPIISNICVKT